MSNLILTPELLAEVSMLYSITCIQRPPKGRTKNGLWQQIVFKYKFYVIDLWRTIVLEKRSVEAVYYLIQVVSNTGLTVLVCRVLWKGS